MTYVSEIVPTSNKGRFYAFGRVFSGTIAPGKCTSRARTTSMAAKGDLSAMNIQRSALMMGRTTKQIADVPCGNTVALVGDQYWL